MRVAPRSSLGKLLLAIAAAVCLALVSTTARAQDDDPPAQTGRLSSISGAVSVQPAGSDDWGQAYPNLPLGPGDRLFTDRDGRAEIQVGQTYVRLGPNSDVTFVDSRADAITFGIGQGAVHVRTMGLWPQQSLYVQTPSGSSTVTQQADFRVDVLPDDNAAVFTTYFGNAYVSGAGGLGMNTAQGQALELVGSNPVYPEWLQPSYPDDLDRWSQGRDQQITRATAYRYVSPEMPGAYDLDASGDWEPGTEYGNIWFPRVQAGWQPYHNGHWVNRDPWGWVWVEDESWGYAPFHYGRWVNYRGRWGWIPGPPAARPVYSPALVVFAGGVQAGGVGVSVWFPLGPGEAYRPSYHASQRYIDQVNISNIQESRSVHVQKTYVNVVNVTNVTNVTNITYVNQTTGVTAMRREDMASGRPAAQGAVHVDPQQMQHIQVLARPQAVPTRQASVGAPPAHAVPVAVQRPVLINAKGMMAPAKPNAQPMAPPVKAAPAPRALPGRTVVAPPPGVKMPPPPPGRPVEAVRPGTQPSPQPNSHPVAQPSSPGQPGARPANQPAIAPPAKPPVPPLGRPAPQTVPQPVPQPAPRPAPVPDNRPAVRPPVQPEPQPAPKPAPLPPAQARPAPVPDNRPAVRPPVQPEPKPAPRQEVRPVERPVPPPPPPQARPTPPPPARPNVQPEPKPAPKPATPPKKDNRTEKQKQEDEKKPQP